MITTDEYNKLRFNQKLGLECSPLKIHAALLLKGTRFNTRTLGGVLFLFRHLKATVVTDSEIVSEFANSSTTPKLLVSFNQYKEYNTNVVNWVFKNYIPFTENLQDLYNLRDRYFERFISGIIAVSNERKASHVEKILLHED